jgi:endonuclease/exonuclease/phosphatase family metal-dependent hydrolase
MTTVLAGMTAGLDGSMRSASGDRSWLDDALATSPLTGWKITRRARRRWPAVVVTVLATLPACSAEGIESPGPPVSVMTRNLYLGTGLNNIVGVSSQAELVTAVDEDWSHVLANDFTTRAGALAEEILSARPDVVGLQEVALYRDQTPSDIRTHPGPNATHVVLDLLAILQSELNAGGTPYTAVATSTNADLEVSRSDADDGLVDVRITDRDVVLVRSDVADQVSDPAHGHYTAVRMLPSWPRPIASTRGWASIDYSPDRRTTVRILTTHLEVSGPRAGRIQERQAQEALTLIAASPHPVIALGDFNSPADGPGTGTYARLTEVLDDAWEIARPADPGPTCCQAELLDNAVGQEDARFDLVLVPEGWRVGTVGRTGAEPFRTGPPPLWASDHVGVTAQVTVPG